MRDVVHALFMRELKTRFGSSRLGYFWALVEPLFHIGIFAAMYYLTGRDTIAGQPAVLFLMTGIVPWLFFAKTLKQVSSAIGANQALFAYRQVKPIDTFITRALMELSIFFVTYSLLIIIFGWFGYDVQPQDLLIMVGAYTALFFMAVAFGVMVASASLFWQDSGKIVDMVMRPLYFVSGIMFSVQVIPTQYWHYFQWNPMMHMLDMGRVGFFHGYQSEFYQPWYIFSSTLSALVIAVMLYRINRERYVMQ